MAGACVVAGSGHPGLAIAVASAVGAPAVACELERFPDGERGPVVGDVRGADVYVVQPTGPPVDEHLVELLLVVDACRRAGADRVTAVVPYFGYARQDRRSRAGEPIGARVVLDALAAVGTDRLVVVDPHTPALEAMAPMAVEILTAVPVVAAALAPLASGAVLVAPDLGAVRLAEAYAKVLDRPVAVVRKSRLTGQAVRAEELVGEVAGRPVVVVDDMISTGATIEATLRLLRSDGAAAPVTVAATHGLLLGGALGRMTALGAARVLVTDTLPPPGGTPAASDVPVPGEPSAVERCSVAPLIAGAIARLHADVPLDGLRLHG